MLQFFCLFSFLKIEIKNFPFFLVVYKNFSLLTLDASTIRLDNGRLKLALVGISEVNDFYTPEQYFLLTKYLLTVTHLPYIHIVI
jgi:hypothetical protein